MLDSDDRTEALPSELNTVTHPRFLAVSKDKTTVRYVGRGNHSQDVGAVRANRPCPQRVLVYYFEVTIVDGGSRGSIAIGLADGSFALNRQPGWEPNSYGYHGYDGRRYADSERGEHFAPRFGTGDVVGCGLLAARREVFFTKNGQHLGVAFAEIAPGRYYPTVGLHSPGEVVSLNFGGAPFTFDVDALAVIEGDASIPTPRSMPLPDGLDMGALVRGYLLHFGYEETLAALDGDRAAAAGVDAGSASGDGDRSSFAQQSEAADAAATAGAASDSARCGDEDDERRVRDGHCAASGGKGGGVGASVGAGVSSSDGAAGGKSSADATAPGETREAAVMRATLPRRRELCEGLRSGDADGVLGRIALLYPGLLDRHPYVHFRLRCQGFIERVRRGDLMEAVRYAQAELSAYHDGLAGAPVDPSVEGAASELADVFELVAYECGEGEASTVSRGGGGAAAASASNEGGEGIGARTPSALLGDGHREATADLLNSAILQEHGLPASCAIERLLRQLLAVHAAARDANDGYGADFRLLTSRDGERHGTDGGGGGGEDGDAPARIGRRWVGGEQGAEGARV